MLYPILIGYAIGRLVGYLVVNAVILIVTILKELIAGLVWIVKACLTKR